MTKEEFSELVKMLLKDEVIANVFEENGNIVVKFPNSNKFYVYIY